MNNYLRRYHALAMYIICLFQIVVSCAKDDSIKVTSPGLLVNTYCALGASTAALPWQEKVSKNIANHYKCYAIGGTRWSHTANSAMDTSSNASNNNDNKTMSNELLRLLNDKKSGGYIPDLIVIMCGLNDAVQGTTIIGDYDAAMAPDLSKVSISAWFTDTTYQALRERVYGSMRYVLEELIRNFPNSQLVVLTCQQCNSGGYNYTNVSAVNNAIVKMSNRYSIPVIDVFNESGITDAGGLLYLYSDDGLHPNAYGQEILTNFVTAKLRYIYSKK